MREYSGKLITLEGIEGAGKSSVIPLLREDLIERGLDVLVTREPGGTAMAEQIRHLLLEARDESVDPVTETLLVWAARRQHWKQLIEPALIAGSWVICDRFIDSSIAYQQFGRQVSATFIQMLHKETLSDYQPSFTLLFAIDLEQAMERLHTSGKVLDRIEHEQAAFFDRVIIGYQSLAKEQAQRLVVVEASQEQHVVAQAARAELARFIDTQIEPTENR